MKIATWNVNSIKVRLEQVLDWLQANTPDVLCLQELKCDNDAFPHTAFADAGWHCAVNGQKTYNGVAIISREAATDVHCDLPLDDPQKRLIAATVRGVRVVSAYFPNGEAPASEKYTYKMTWLQALHGWLQETLPAHEKFVLTGDYNIAPQPEDAHESWPEGGILVSAQERAAFAGLLDLGLHDAFRLFPQEPASWSWWDYRRMAFRRKVGLRIDHILISPALLPQAKSCHIDIAPRRLERPSDHAPVVFAFDAG